MAGFILGIVLTTLFYSELAKITSQLISLPLAANTLAYVLLFFATMTVVTIVGRLLEKIIRLVLINWLDQGRSGLQLGFIGEKLSPALDLSIYILGRRSVFFPAQVAHELCFLHIERRFIQYSLDIEGRKDLPIDTNLNVRLPVGQFFQVLIGKGGVEHRP
jgi:hypothetical protein